MFLRRRLSAAPTPVREGQLTCPSADAEAVRMHDFGTLTRVQ